MRFPHPFKRAAQRRIDNIAMLLRLAHLDHPPTPEGYWDVTTFSDGMTRKTYAPTITNPDQRTWLHWDRDTKTFSEWSPS